MFYHPVLSRSYISDEERSKSDCKSIKESNAFIFGVSVYSVKWFSGIKSSLYRTGPMGIDGLPEDESNHGTGTSYQERLSPVKIENDLE